jgi:hypothetical protein
MNNVLAPIVWIGDVRLCAPEITHTNTKEATAATPQCKRYDEAFQRSMEGHRLLSANQAGKWHRNWFAMVCPFKLIRFL